MWKVRKCKGGGVRGSGVRVWKVRMCKGEGVRRSGVRVWKGGQIFSALIHSYHIL